MARGSKPFRRGNRWAGVVDIGTDPLTGKRRQQWVTGATAEEVDRQLVAILADLHRGVYVEPTHLTLADYLPQWLESRTKLRESTRDSYRRVIALHLVPALGRRKLAQLTPLEIERFYAGKRAAGLGESRLQTIHSVLSSALGAAVRWGMIARNPCALVDAPHGTVPEIAAWDGDTADAFVVATAGEPLGMAWNLALRTTMRRGELLGLRWRDLDLERRTAFVHVQTPVWRADLARWEWQELKTATSRRVIPLRRPVVAALREHRRRQTERRLALGPGWHDLDLVLERGDGLPWKPTSVSWAFADAVRRHDVPRINLHGLRHTAITLMLASGIPQHEVRRIAGHASLAMTDRYTHPTDAHLMRQLDRMDEGTG